jgi:hypothetical protein
MILERDAVLLVLGEKDVRFLLGDKMNRSPSGFHCLFLPETKPRKWLTEITAPRDKEWRYAPSKGPPEAFSIVVSSSEVHK